MFLTRKIKKLRDIIFDIRRCKVSALSKHITLHEDYPKINKIFTYEFCFYEKRIRIKYKDIKITEISGSCVKWRYDIPFPKNMIKELEKEVEELLIFYKKIDKETLTYEESVLNEERKILEKDFKEE